MTKIKLGKNDYLLCIKPKNDQTPWSKIAPLIEPKNIPLFEVGTLAAELKNKLNNEAAERRNKKIEYNDNKLSDEEYKSKIRMEGVSKSIYNKNADDMEYVSSLMEKMVDYQEESIE